jgi:AcrR family transcriptional regulator
MSGATPHLSFREQVHQLLRESILDAAFERAVKADWEAVRIADIAKDVGVSRQTIYNEFGTKQQLSEAVFNREMQSFLSGLVDVVNAADTMEQALRDSLKSIFAQARDHELLQRMLLDAREGRSTALLPLLTTNSYLIVRPVRALLAVLYESRWPTGLENVERLAELIVRLTISYIVLQSDYPEEDVIDDITMAVLSIIGTAGNADA